MTAPRLKVDAMGEPSSIGSVCLTEVPYTSEGTIKRVDLSACPGGYRSVVGSIAYLIKSDVPREKTNEAVEHSIEEDTNFPTERDSDSMVEESNDESPSDTSLTEFHGVEVLRLAACALTVP